MRGLAEPLPVLWFRGPLGRLHAFLVDPVLEEISQCGRVSVEIVSDEPHRRPVGRLHPQVCPSCAVVVFPQPILEALGKLERL